jgi:hypothetical protein
MQQFTYPRWLMKNKIKVMLGRSTETNAPAGIPAFYLIKPPETKGAEPTKTLLISLNLPLDQVNNEPEIFNRFVFIWEDYARESGYEFDYDKELFEKTGKGWKVVG